MGCHIGVPNIEGGFTMNSATETRYDTRLNVLFRPLEIVEAGKLAAEAVHPWYNQTLCEVNESVVRLGVLRGEYHWHHHDSDEFFYVVEGKLLVDLEGRTLELVRGEGVVIPKTVEHRPRAPEKTVVIMVENKGIIPTGT
jgi:mannose-6-phosphate isomerase-like protein (cupin superfamily)